MTQFKDLKLSSKLLKTLADKGYSTPTDIQREAIPHILEGRDIQGIAQTGSGKTGAFSIPMIENLSRSKQVVKAKRARALVLTPTRELANQINGQVEIYSKGMNLSSAVIFGGVGPLNQVRKLATGVDLLIATPGRLLDFLQRGHIKLDELETFVLDEADRMLDMGFIKDIEKIIERLPKKRQTLFFSATMPKDISKLASTILTKPKIIEVSPPSTPVESIAQYLIHIDRVQKPKLLKKIINESVSESVIVFTRTKYGADRVCKHLMKAGIESSSIHSNRSQGAREKALAAFRNKKIKALVATDIAARGIDVDGISHVINYDVPLEAESYIHRIGRTARAGKSGVAYTFCDPAETKSLKAVEKLLGFKIKVNSDFEITEETDTIPPINNPGRKLRNPNLTKKKANKKSQKKVIKPKAPSKKRFTGKKKPTKS
ncbi:DEAD/DEAH box helicase [Halobacteriovorax marinus]|uniref:DEAD/DEAH box helicase n=1 Tax=Halobacteriovorax marinus TaxID=97084 RepID=UPI000BC2F21D|nr:DEAD/DEAH box helicase [Halobacteriovorax marinus]ATH07214.1 DEAD/DEAH box helicase [Halobacteriovorax marinus]